MALAGAAGAAPSLAAGAACVGSGVCEVLGGALPGYGMFKAASWVSSRVGWGSMG